MDYKGNIDLWNRPVVPNPDGGTSTLFSMGVNLDGQEVLIPRVRSGLDRIMTEDEAIQHYLDTGEHLGKYQTVDEANNAGAQLHTNQEEIGRLKLILGDILNPKGTIGSILSTYYGVGGE